MRAWKGTRQVGELIPARWRRWAYRVGMAAVPLLVFYGLVADAAAGLWLGLLGAVIGAAELEMAARHVPRDGG